MHHKIEGLTIAITNMEQMVYFYSELFGIEFTEKAMFGATLYAGHWGPFKLLFCPADIAQNTATQNRHQFDIVVPDIRLTIQLAKELGGTIMGELTEDETSLAVGIYDPDRNSIAFKQLKA